MLDNWSRRQKRVFKEFFNNNEGLSIEEAKKQLQGTKEIWLRLYAIIGKSGIKLSEYSIIQTLKKEHSALLLRIAYNRLFFIDLLTNKSLQDKDLLDIFTTKEVLDFIGPTGNFTIEQLPDQTCQEIIDLYIENQDVFERGSALNYEVEHNGDKACLSMNLATNGIVLPFFGKKGEQNCILFEGYKPDGMTGECDHNTAVIMGQMTKDIIIPQQIVTHYQAYPNNKTLKKEL